MPTHWHQKCFSLPYQGGERMLTQQQFNNKWEEIKGALRNLWGRLEEDELENVKGNIYEVTGLVETKYGESKEEIRNKLNQLMDSFDNDTDKGLNPDVSSYQRSPLGESYAETQEFSDISSHTPNHPRTSETSQIQDADFGERFPEQESFADKTYNRTQDELDDPNSHSNYSGANPGRSGFGFARDHQDSTLKDKQD